MNAKPTLARPHVATTVVAAMLAVLIGIGLFAGITDLFQRTGTPFEQLIIAEHACAEFSFESERKTCVDRYLTAWPRRNIASR